MNQWGTISDNMAVSPFIKPASQLSTWQLIKQSYALIWQERANIPRVVGLIMLAEFLCYQFGSWLGKPIVTVICSLFALTFFHIVFQLRWYRFLLLGKIPTHFLGDWGKREWQLLRYGAAISLIMIGLGTAIGVPIGLVAIYLSFGPASLLTKMIIGVIAVILGLAGGLYVNSLYTLVFPHIAVRLLDSRQPVMKWARKALQPRIWPLIFAHGLGITLLIFPFSILIIAAVFLGFVAIPFNGLSPAAMAAQWATSSVIAVLEIGIAFMMYVAIWLFHATLAAVTYYHLVVAAGSTADSEQPTAFTPMHRLMAKKQTGDVLIG